VIKRRRRRRRKKMVCADYYRDDRPMSDYDFYHQFGKSILKALASQKESSESVLDNAKGLGDVVSSIGGLGDSVSSIGGLGGSAPAFVGYWSFINFIDVDFFKRLETDQNDKGQNYKEWKEFIFVNTDTRKYIENQIFLASQDS
jgi:hypothetical protein